MSKIAKVARKTIQYSKQKVQEKLGGFARIQVILILAFVLGLDSADKATISAVSDNLKHAFHINNTDIGLLIAIVSFIGSVFTLPFGILVDRMKRKYILIVAVSFWTLATVISGTSTSFTYLIVTRVFLGMVAAAAFPSVASLVGDFFPAHDRARIYGLILSGEFLGAGIGFFISSEVASALNWRWPFYLMGIPGAALVWVLWRYLPEPARGGQNWISWDAKEVPSEEDAKKNQKKNDNQQKKDPEQSGKAEKAQESMLKAGVMPRSNLILHEDPTNKSLWWAFKYVIRIPTFLLLIIASSLVYFFFSGVRAFIMVYLPKHYDVSHSTISSLLIIPGIGALSGVLLGGNISEWLFDRQWFNARIIVPAVSLFLSALFFGPGIWTKNIYLGIFLLTFAALFMAAANPPIDAARLDIMHPRLWGRAEATRMTLRSISEGIAPILFGLISEWLGGGEKGLMWTYLIMLIPLLAASFIAIPARYTYPRDVATAGASVNETSKK